MSLFLETNTLASKITQYILCMYFQEYKGEITICSF